MSFLEKMLQLPLGLEPRHEKPPANEGTGRRIALEAGILDYGLVRARRRTLGITIGREGVQVRAPRWAPVGEVERFLREKEQWIWRHLHARRQAPRAFTWSQGDCIPLFGEMTPLEIRRVAARPRERQVLAEGSRLVACVLADDGTGELQSLVHAWMRSRLLATVGERAIVYAGRLGVPSPEVRISGARTRWGSCSAAGRVSLSWRLIHMPLRLIDYVVAHEIAHLREMNHSSRFWSTLEGIYPGCREARRELNAMERQLPEL